MGGFFRSEHTTQAFAGVYPLQHQIPHKDSRDTVAETCFFQGMLPEEDNHFDDFNSNAEVKVIGMPVL